LWSWLVKPPRSIILSLKEACNLDVRSCFQHDGHPESGICTKSWQFIKPKRSVFLCKKENDSQK
jgi:hypothetical protein